MPPKNSSNVNSTFKRVVLDICGKTGDRQCTFSILYPSSQPQTNSVGSTEPQCVTVDSVSFIPNSNDSYEYMFTFSSSNPYNENNTPISINFFTEANVLLASFAFTYIAGSSTEHSSGFPVLTDSQITTYNSSYNCYTINSGTYNVTFSAGSGSAPMCGGGALYFSSGDDPLSQTITITTSS